MQTSSSSCALKTPKDYQCVVLPIGVAETAAQTNLALFRMKKHDGSDHKPGKVWFSFYPTKARTPDRQKLLDLRVGIAGTLQR